MDPLNGRRPCLSRWFTFTCALCGFAATIPGSIARTSPLFAGERGPRSISADPRNLVGQRSDMGMRLADLTQSEYVFSPDGESAFSAPNRAHDLRAKVTPSGIEIVSRTRPNAAFRLALEVVGFGRPRTVPRLGALEAQGLVSTPGDASRQNPGRLVAHEPRIEIQRDAMIEWYVNGPKGIEQGFTLLERPAATACEGTPVVIELAVRGTLTPVVEARAEEEGVPSRSLLFEDARGEPVLRYAQLQATDAAGREVRSRLSIAPGRILIELEDRDALYPLTVDPLLTSPVWTAESDQTGASFGSALQQWADATAGANDLRRSRRPAGQIE